MPLGKGSKAPKIDFCVLEFISSFKVVISNGQIQKMLTNLHCPSKYPENSEFL